VIGAGARIGDGAVLLSHVVVYPGVIAGRNLFAHAHAVVREGCVLGDNVILQNGVVIGGDGFGFAKRDDGSWQKIPQSGPVRIGNDVEIQSNACIDRASVGATVIADGAKIDNLVQVGHGSTVGENTLLCAQVGLAGSTEVGRNVVLAGQVGVAGHCRIGDGVIATAQSGIPNDVAAGKVVSGYPAIDNRQWLRASAVFQRLPQLLRRRPAKAAEKSSSDE
jgi:UDP-3-O-[3-hydroxymyristoyl] glucosamine N-acyltransferase